MANIPPVWRVFITITLLITLLYYLFYAALPMDAIGAWSFSSVMSDGSLRFLWLSYWDRFVSLIIVVPPLVILWALHSQSRGSIADKIIMPVASYVILIFGFIHCIINVWISANFIRVHYTHNYGFHHVSRVGDSRNSDCPQRLPEASGKE